MVVNNPNNWHWVDKNCIDWTRQYFKDTLIENEETSIETADNNKSYKISLTNLKKLEGDVEVCQRKGKVISLFDFEMVLELTASAASSADAGSGDIKGTISIPEIAYDTEEDEYQFEISLDNSGNSLNDVDLVKKSIRNQLVPILRQKLFQFGKDLIKTHGSDIQVSSSSTSTTNTSAKNTTNDAAVKKTQTSSFINKSSSSDSKPSDKKTEKVASSGTHQQKKNLYNTTSLTITDSFHTTAEQIYLTLLDPQRVQAWTRSADVQIEPKENTDFKLFGGNIQGKILQLVPNESIKMLWRLEEWKQGHYTELTINLKQNESDTTILIKFDGVPIGDEEKVEDNFKNYYIRSIKLTFGFGTVL